MDVYVARQPIFDRNMNIFGYELLYRRSMNNFYEGIDDNQSTAELINNTFLTMHFEELTSGTIAFINFSQDMLIKEIPLLLPKELIAVEVLENVEISDGLIEACKKLKEEGYILALDDFVFNEYYIPLIELANIIKIEFSKIDHDIQKTLINKYNKKIKFLAEKIETREEYQLALSMGYDYFQGYFFSKPVIMKGKEIGNLNISILRIMDVLMEEEPDYQKMTDIIETDLGLSYKLLKIANSVVFGTRNKIHSLKHALVQLGITELRKWLYILMLKDIQNVANKELIKNCLIRAKFMELIAINTGKNDKKSEYFLTGMFSSIDILMNRNMKELTNELPLSTDVKKALLGESNEIKKILDIVISYEEWENWNKEDIHHEKDITQEVLINCYIEALTWILRLDY